MPYSDEEKEKVVKFVFEYNKKHGQGGLHAAKDEFSINPISIKKWVSDAEKKQKLRKRS